MSGEDHEGKGPIGHRGGYRCRGQNADRETRPGYFWAHRTKENKEGDGGGPKNHTAPLTRSNRPKAFGVNTPGQVAPCRPGKKGDQQSLFEPMYTKGARTLGGEV